MDPDCEVCEGHPEGCNRCHSNWWAAMAKYLKQLDDFEAWSERTWDPPNIMVKTSTKGTAGD